MFLVNINELSEFLKVKKKTLYQWAELKQIPHIKLNGTLRFDLDEIKKWVSGCALQPESGYNSFAKLEARKGVKRI